ncbi:hypothetical protein FC25_GL000723 [Ligilactobacillus ruminis DSM 20403 = NBRC 102161]|nr:hypothetical protein FC25_GL000723 [Ligilactobacillus ruminis DSM 20403 = NBRC 102161]
MPSDILRTGTKASQGAFVFFPTSRLSQNIETFEIKGLCQMVLMTSKTSLQKWSGVFLFPSVSPVFFQIGTVTYQHRLRFHWRGCHATLDGNEGGNDRFSCICIVSFYSIAKIFCEYKKWC